LPYDEIIDDSPQRVYNSLGAVSSKGLPSIPRKGYNGTTQGKGEGTAAEEALDTGGFRIGNRC